WRSPDREHARGRLRGRSEARLRSCRLQLHAHCALAARRGSLKRKLPSAARPLSAVSLAMAQPIRILGIDPGLRRTGWGVIAMAGNALSFVAAGTVRAPLDGELAARLLALHEGLSRVISAYRPDEAAVEQTFVNRDATATLKLGQA